MISHTTKRFWKLHAALPEQIRRQAKVAYRKFQQDPYQAGLQFKQIHETQPFFRLASAAITAPSE
jgi:hypothetical protein